MESYTMNQEEFDRYQQMEKRSFLKTHWPRVQHLLSQGKTPQEVAAQMSAEGYQGMRSSRFHVGDIHYLQDLSCSEQPEAERAVSHSAEFPVEAVREILQVALDDGDADQTALLWAAYLFGFDRSRVTGAAGAGDEVHLRFASAECQEQALDEFRRLRAQE